MNSKHHTESCDLSSLVPRYFTISISPENMLAEGVLNPRSEGVEIQDEMPVLLLLRSMGVKYGVLPTNIRAFIKRLAEPSETRETFVLAKGKPPEAPPVPKVELFFAKPLEEIRMLAPMSGDEFRETLFSTILLPRYGIAARVYGAESGEAGITVKRQELPPIPGAAPPYTFKRGFSEEEKADHLEYSATREGIPRIHNSIVTQVPVQTISDNLVIPGADEYLTHLFIEGNISGGGELKVDGNLYVQGKVLNANIEVTGNLVIADRVLGRRKSRIVCGGHFCAGQVEGVELRADGVIIVREALFNSSVVGDMGVEVVDGSGVIVGGNVRSCGRIKAKRIGTVRGIRTVLQMQDQVRYKSELKEVRETIKDLLNNITLVEQFVSALQQNIPRNQILARKQQRQIDEMMNKQLELLTEMCVARAKEDHFGGYIKSMENKRIEVLDNIYPGVEINFNGEMQEILDETGAIEITEPKQSMEPSTGEERNDERR